jgi:mannose-6-phosphate isomerase
MADIVALNCPAAEYGWGKQGSTSVVAQLKDADAEFTIDEAQPYAEYWMGTHVNGPAQVVLPAGKTPLREFLLKQPASMQNYPQEYESYKATGELPYLFKILSVAKALSIQAHPDKALAEKIHAATPDIYKDPNHKPEMALAITPMEALCQFRKLSEISTHLDTTPELRKMCGDAESAALQASAAANEDNTPAGKAALKALFETFMKSDAGKIAEHHAALVARLSALEWSMRTHTESLVLRCNEQFPGDIGGFCCYLLNYVTLQPGEAMFLAANEPHAYLSGDLAECMACSDNVIRSGLTPKFKDVELLCDCLTYNTGKAPVQTGVQTDECTLLYTPPVSEFEMINTTVAAGGQYQMPSSSTPQIMLAINGSGQCGDKELTRGSILLSMPGAAVSFQAGADGLQVYSARCNQNMK